MKKARKVGAAAPKMPVVSPRSLLALARQHAAAGRWREAIAACKDLIKIDDRPESRSELAAAYAGRARELAAKGMPREALTIWENRAQIAPGLPPDPGHCHLLLRLGRAEEAVDLCARWGNRLEPAALTALRSHLAAHHLAGEPGIAAGLPAEDPILVQGVAATQAIDAYCRGDDEALAGLLATIPFRSPYRDLAQCLKALQRLPTAPAEAAGLLARVGDDSGFASLCQACALALGPPATVPERPATAGEVARRFALTLSGWGAARQALWEEAHKTADPGGPRTLLRLLHRHRAMLGEDWARRQALRLLLPGFPKSATWITEGGGRRLSEEERLLIAAWQAEDRQDLFAALDAWDRYVSQLNRGGLPVPGSDAALRVALVLRRVDSRSNILASKTPTGVRDDLDVYIADRVETSLEYDPDDWDSYERLVRYHLRGGDLKTVRRFLDQALQRFPADLGLLTAALDTALAGDAFKKATRYAREILALDPINRGARERLVKAHLAHARKQLRAGRQDLARKELDQAAEWDPDGLLRERRALLGGLLDLRQDQARGRQVLRDQVAALGGGLAAALALALEAVGVGRPAVSTLKAVDLGRLKALDQADLSAFLGRLRAQVEGGEVFPPELQRLFEKPLGVAADWPLAQAESESACDTLRRAGLTRARLAFAEAALKRWPGAPVFVLHQFESRFADGRRYPHPADIDRLTAAGERARGAGDQRTTVRIQDALRPYAFSPFFAGPGGFFDEEGDDDDEDDEALFDSPFPLDVGPEDALRAIIEIMGVDQLLKMAGLSAKERAEFKKLERQLGRDGMVDAVIELMREHLPDFGRGLPPGPAPGAPPDVRGGRRRKGPNPSGPKTPAATGQTGGGNPADPEDPDDGPKQFELF